MKKYLMLAGIFTVLAGNAQSAGWYYEDDGYNQYEARQQYNNQDYYSKQPRYQQLPSSASRRYQERQYTRSQNMNTYHSAETNKIRPYIGLDVMTTTMDFGENDVVKDYEGGDNYFKDNLNAFSIVGGAKFNKNFGIEAFYQKSGEEENKVEDYGFGHDISNIEYTAYGLDFQGYIPLGQDFEILASLGIAQYDFETSEQYYMDTPSGPERVGDGNNDFDSLGIRLGIGGQYNITDHIALRAMARYIHMTDDEYIKSMTELSLGLRYMF